MPIILKVFNDFLRNFMNDLFLLLDREKEINLDLISQKVLKFNMYLQINLQKLFIPLRILINAKITILKEVK